MASIRLTSTTVKMNNPGSISYFPLLADSNEMDDKNKKKAKAQANKVNTSITSMFDDFAVKTTQGQQTTNATYRASSYRSQIVDNVKDTCYNEYCTMSFDFYAINIKKDSITPLFRLGVNSIVGNILFTGLDNKDKPTSTLANYGFFTLTRNEVIGEQQLSFYATKSVPEKIWYCSLQFIAAGVNKDVSILETQEETV